MTRSDFVRHAAAVTLIVAFAQPTLGQKKESKPPAKPSTQSKTVNVVDGGGAGLQQLGLTFNQAGLLVQPNTIGVTVAPTDPVLRAHLKLTKGKHGVVVTRVLPNGRAAKAGVRAHDILLRINDKPVSTAKHLSGIVGSAKGKALRLKLIRAARYIDLTVKPAPPKETIVNLQTVFAYSGWKYKIGVQTQPADPSLIAQLVLPPSTGLVIRSVESKGPAAKAGIQKHDVILKAADKYLSKDDDLRKAIDKAAGKPLTLEFLRAGRKQTCTVTPKKRENSHLLHYYWLDAKHKNDGLLELKVVSRAMAEYDMFLTRPKTGDVHKQLKQMSRQLAELQKSMQRLQKTLAAQPKKKK